MSAPQIFGLQFALSLVVYGLIARWYLVGIRAICRQREKAAFAALSRIPGAGFEPATFGL